MKKLLTIATLIMFVFVIPQHANSQETGFPYYVTNGTNIDIPVEPLSKAETASDYYGYFTPGGSTGVPEFGTQSNTAFIWLYENELTGQISLCLIFDTLNDAGGGTVNLAFYGVPSSGFVELADDPPGPSLTDDEFTVNEGNWLWYACCGDGGIIGGLSGVWEITISLVSSTGIDHWYFLSGPSPSSPEFIQLDMKNDLTIFTEPSFKLVKIIELNPLVGDDGSIEVDVVGDELYVANWVQDVYYRIDPVTSTVLGSFALGNGILIDNHGSEFFPGSGRIIQVSDDDAGGALPFDAFFETDLNGNVLHGPFDLFGPGDNSEDPQGLTVDPSTGRIWVSTHKTPQDIFEINPNDGTILNQIDIGGGRAHGLAFNPISGNIYFAAESGIIKEVAPDGTGLAAVFNPNVGIINGMAFTPTGDLAILDFASPPIAPPSRLLLYDSSYDDDDVFTTTPPAPEPSIEAILDFFDKSVADYTLEGKGPGNSADNRLNAFRNMLLSTQEMINEGNIKDASDQLMSIYEKCDRNDIPPDFVQGESQAALADMIYQLLVSAGAGETGLEMIYGDPNVLTELHCYGLHPWSDAGERHGGIDLKPPYKDLVGTSTMRKEEVVAPAAGVVDWIVKGTTGAGAESWVVILKMNNYWYAVLVFEPQSLDPEILSEQDRSIDVIEGQQLLRGDRIGDLVVGNVMAGRYPHIHFSFLYKNPVESIQDLFNDPDSIVRSDGTDLAPIAGAGSPWEPQDLDIPSTFFCPYVYSTPEAQQTMDSVDRYNVNGELCSCVCAYNSENGDCGVCPPP